jgi:SecY
VAGHWDPLGLQPYFKVCPRHSAKCVEAHGCQTGSAPFDCHFAACVLSSVARFILGADLSMRFFGFVVARQTSVARGGRLPRRHSNTIVGARRRKAAASSRATCSKSWQSCWQALDGGVPEQPQPVQHLNYQDHGFRRPHISLDEWAWPQPQPKHHSMSQWQRRQLLHSRTLPSRTQIPKQHFAVQGPRSTTRALCASARDLRADQWLAVCGVVQGLIAFSRLGVYLRLPGVDVDRFAESMRGGGLLGYIDALSGGSISKVGVFSLGGHRPSVHLCTRATLSAACAMLPVGSSVFVAAAAPPGIVPYINASIILQLLATAFPSLKKLQREEGPQARLDFCRISTKFRLLLGAPGPPGARSHCLPRRQPLPCARATSGLSVCLSAPQGRARFMLYQKLVALGFAVAQSIGQLNYIRPFVDDYSSEWLLVNSLTLTAGAMILVHVRRRVLGAERS